MPVRLSANTSAYSQARSKLPVEVAEKVSDRIFESLNERPQILPGLEQPMFLLDGSTILLAHSDDLVVHYPPPCNQHGASHWPVIRVVVAHDVVSGLAVRRVWGPDQRRSQMQTLSPVGTDPAGDKPTCAAACVVYGTAAVSEQGLAKVVTGRLPAGCGVLGDRNFGVFSMAWHAAEQGHPCLFRLTDARATKLNHGILPSVGSDRRIRWDPSRDDLRNNPEISSASFVEGRLLAFRTREPGGKWQKLYFFTVLTLPAQQVLELYGIAGTLKPISAL